MSLEKTADEETLARADLPGVRFLALEAAGSGAPQADLPGEAGHAQALP